MKYSIYYIEQNYPPDFLRVSPFNTYLMKKFRNLGVSGSLFFNNRAQKSSNFLR